MRKVVAAINMTLDGDCDHNSGIADDETHKHYSELLLAADTIIYGRKTYQLMENYWPSVVEAPTGEKGIDEFAVSLQNITKIVFSNTLKNVSWQNSVIAHQDLQQTISELKQHTGRDILIGSPSMIIAALNQNLVDEFQICIHPIISGGTMLLFKNITSKINLSFLKTKVFKCGAMVIFYKLEI